MKLTKSILLRSGGKRRFHPYEDRVVDIYFYLEKDGLLSQQVAIFSAYARSCFWAIIAETPDDTGVILPYDLTTVEQFENLMSTLTGKPFKATIK